MLMTESGSLKTAISWYKNAGSWVINYKDTGSKIQALSYEIAIKLAATAKTKGVK